MTSQKKAQTMLLPTKQPADPPTNVKQPADRCQVTNQCQINHPPMSNNPPTDRPKTIHRPKWMPERKKQPTDQTPTLDKTTSRPTDRRQATCQPMSSNRPTPNKPLTDRQIQPADRPKTIHRPKRTPDRKEVKNCTQPSESKPCLNKTDQRTSSKPIRLWGKKPNRVAEIIPQPTDENSNPSIGAQIAVKLSKQQRKDSEPAKVTAKLNCNGDGGRQRNRCT